MQCLHGASFKESCYARRNGGSIATVTVGNNTQYLVGKGKVGRGFKNVLFITYKVQNKNNQGEMTR